MGLLTNLQASSPPYPSALGSANVVETSLANLKKNGLIVANGELNAIVYTVGNDLHLRISKNDCWDSRVDTSNDPALPTVNAATSSFTGKAGDPPSWKAPYPNALPCAEVTLGAVAGQTGWESATLNLANASTTVVSSSDTSQVRVLAQSNAILINSSRKLTFTGINQVVKDYNGNSIASWVTNASLGTSNGYSYLIQTIPGDADAAGMSVCLVAGSNKTTQVIGVVTSRESSDPLSSAITLVSAELADSGAIAKHESNWQDFWSKSGIQIDDSTMQNWWYRLLYFNRCFAQANGNVIGLKAGIDQLAGWHDSLKINYNTQQSYILGGPVNHPEFIEPLINDLTRNLNRAKWFAATAFMGSEGAFFHSDSWPFEPDPANCVTRNKHQFAYMPYGYSWGMQGQLAVNLWEYYKYNPSSASLNKIYPVLSEIGLFYCSMLENCKLLNGQWKIGPSFLPEVGSYGQYDTCYDITYINYCLKAVITAATLEGDTALANRCETDLALMPDYSTTTDPNQGGQTVMAEWLGSGLQGSDKHATVAQSVFPSGEINWFSDPTRKAFGLRSLQRESSIVAVQNSVVTYNVATARMSSGTTISNTKKWLSPTASVDPEQPNGLFALGTQGYFNGEQVGIARIVTELLLQSVGDIIRVFPEWPEDEDAHFSNLLAQGGFKVSADQVAGAATNLRITSTVGGDVSLLNPWSNQAVGVWNLSTSSDTPFTADSDGVITFATTAQQSYEVSPGFEAEKVAYVSSPGVSSVLADSSFYSNGEAVELKSTASGQFIRFTLPNVPAGTYDLLVYYKSYNDRGVVQASVNSSNVGNTLDEYAAVSSFGLSHNFGSFTVTSAGNITVQLTVTGQNPKSKGATVMTDKIVLLQ